MSKKNDPKKEVLPLLTVCIIIVMAVLMGLFIIPNYFRADERGTRVGTNTGTMIGEAAGTFVGMKEKYPQGYADGKEQALSDQEIRTAIGNEVASLNKLEVLVANVKIKNYLEVGKKYSALILYRGALSFYVDFNKMQTSTLDNGSLVIMLPPPQSRLTISDDWDILRDRQNIISNGSTEDGFEAAWNSLNLVEQSASEVVEDYEILMNEAKKAAINQVTRLAENMTGNRFEVSVSFLSEGTV